MNLFRVALFMITTFANFAAASEGIFKQKINHFDDQDARVFDQRYFIDSQYAQNSASPVFFILGGEGGGDGWLHIGEVVMMAQKFGGHIVNLEHRYYGKSWPFPDLSTSSLKYLTVEQAVADNANFERYAISQLHLTGPWVAMGGSYSGMMAAYFRLEHPELVIGALASSAPVEAKPDFHEYDDHLGQKISNACRERVMIAVHEIERRLLIDRKEIKRYFGSEDIEDDQDFLAVVGDMVSLPVQYHQSDKFCPIIEQANGTQNILAAYAKAGLAYFDSLHMKPVDDSFQSARDETGKGEMRQWVYQACTQFGFYPLASLNPQTQTRSSWLTVDGFRNLCRKVFQDPTMREDFASLNQKYYAKLIDPKYATRILFTNGDNDGWSELSITTERQNGIANPEIETMTIPGGDHSGDLMGYSGPQYDPPHKRFEELLKQWGLVSIN